MGNSHSEQEQQSKGSPDSKQESSSKQKKDSDIWSSFRSKSKVPPQSQTLPFKNVSPNFFNSPNVTPGDGSLGTLTKLSPHVESPPNKETLLDASRLPVTAPFSPTMLTPTQLWVPKHPSPYNSTWNRTSIRSPRPSTVPPFSFSSMQDRPTLHPVPPKPAFRIPPQEFPPTSVAASFPHHTQRHWSPAPRRPPEVAPQCAVPTCPAPFQPPHEELMEVISHSSTPRPPPPMESSLPRELTQRVSVASSPCDTQPPQPLQVNSALTQEPDKEHVVKEPPCHILPQPHAPNKLSLSLESADRREVVTGNPQDVPQPFHFTATNLEKTQLKPPSKFLEGQTARPIHPLLANSVPVPIPKTTLLSAANRKPPSKGNPKPPSATNPIVYATPALDVSPTYASVVNATSAPAVNPTHASVDNATSASVANPTLALVADPALTSAVKVSTPAQSESKTGVDSTDCKNGKEENKQAFVFSEETHAEIMSRLAYVEAQKLLQLSQKQSVVRRALNGVSYAEAVKKSQPKINPARREARAKSAKKAKTSKPLGKQTQKENTFSDEGSSLAQQPSNMPVNLSQSTEVLNQDVSEEQRVKELDVCVNTHSDQMAGCLHLTKCKKKISLAVEMETKQDGAPSAPIKLEGNPTLPSVAYNTDKDFQPLPYEDHHSTRPHQLNSLAQTSLKVETHEAPDGQQRAANELSPVPNQVKTNQTGRGQPNVAQNSQPPASINGSKLKIKVVTPKGVKVTVKSKLPLRDGQSCGNDLPQSTKPNDGPSGTIDPKDAKRTLSTQNVPSKLTISLESRQLCSSKTRYSGAAENKLEEQCTEVVKDISSPLPVKSSLQTLVQAKGKSPDQTKPRQTAPVQDSPPHLQPLIQDPENTKLPTPVPSPFKPSRQEGRWPAFSTDRTCKRKVRCPHRENAKLPKNILKWLSTNRNYLCEPSWITTASLAASIALSGRLERENSHP